MNIIILLASIPFFPPPTMFCSASSLLFLLSSRWARLCGLPALSLSFPDLQSVHIVFFRLS